MRHDPCRPEPRPASDARLRAMAAQVLRAPGHAGGLGPDASGPGDWGAPDPDPGRYDLLHAASLGLRPGCRARLRALLPGAVGAWLPEAPHA